ncbi:hypothetical protein OAK91_02865 [Planctomycetaceae bacterium]|nr:hypothetical protein [Planctomycetaceae bacterium]
MSSEAPKRSELRISHELAIGILVAVVGFAGWLTNTSFQIGSMKTRLETSVQIQEVRLTAVEENDKSQDEQIDEHEDRISTLEADQ